jgi:predicted Holliday junction resolvase-like endonuclease
MSYVLGAALFVAVALILVMAVWLYLVHVSMSYQVQQRASMQLEIWRQSECEAIRHQERDLATRRAAVEFNNWKATHETTIRNDAVQRSHSVIVGKVTEHIMPYLPGFRFNPKDARFIGSPVDFVVFDGLDQDSLVQVVFVEVKTGSSTLSKRERQIRDAIRDHRIRWEELRVERNDEAQTVTLFPA